MKMELKVVVIVHTKCARLAFMFGELLELLTMPNAAAVLNS